MTSTARLIQGWLSTPVTDIRRTLDRAAARSHKGEQKCAVTVVQSISTRAMSLFSDGDVVGDPGRVAKC